MPSSQLWQQHPSLFSSLAGSPPGRRAAQKGRRGGDRALVVLRDGSHRLTSGASTSLNGYSRIIPLLLRDCEYKKLSWHLKGIQMVGFRREIESGFRQLLRVWKKDYQVDPHNPDQAKTTEQNKENLL